jgi:hypothetical protein
MGGGSRRIAAILEDQPQQYTQKAGKDGPQPKTSVGYEMEGREEHRRRQYTNQRLQQRSDQGLLCKTGKDRDREGVCDRPASHHVALPTFERGHRWQSAHRPHCSGADHPGTQTPDQADGDGASRCESAEKSLCTERKPYQGYHSHHAFLMDQDGGGNRPGQRVRALRHQLAFVRLLFAATVSGVIGTFALVIVIQVVVSVRGFRSCD